MNSPRHTVRSVLEDQMFHFMLLGVSAALGWILLPFYGSVFWALVMAILFTPLFRRFLTALNGRRTMASLATLLVMLLMVILPLLVLSSSLVQQGSLVFGKIQSGEINFGQYFLKMMGALPPSMAQWLDGLGLGDVAAVHKKVVSLATQGSQFLAAQAWGIGHDTIDFVVGFCITLYLAFFLLRDGATLAGHVGEAIPLQARYKRELFRMFATVIRATVKGNVLIALAQGALGGLAFWFLDVQGALFWAVLMAFLSLLPAVGAGLVWVPVAAYLLVSGTVWQGLGLTAYGVLVIGLVDNLLRPVLVGKDTKMPDYVVLLSTLGGLAVFGINGFVIGPAIAAMFIAAWGMFLLEKNLDADQNTSSEPGSSDGRADLPTSAP